MLRYCEPAIRRVVPLALGLISVSNPQLHILDTLSKFSHDADAEVAHNSIFAMGLIGAGTNNARLAAMLRQVSNVVATLERRDKTGFFFVQNQKTQFRIFRNSDAKNLRKLSFCLKTQFQTFQKQGISEHFHQKLLEKGSFQLIFI